MTKRKAIAKSAKKASEKLTFKQQQFVDELLADENMNATAAYLKVYKCSLKAAESSASTTLRIPKVAAALKVAQDALAARTKVTQEKVLEKLWQIATADANDIMQLRRGCCRHCYGKGHAFQWKDEDELERAIEAEELDAKENERTPAYPSDEGGYGYNPTLTPHALCPKCFGEGHSSVHFNDTRHLKGAARTLYAGVEQTQHGLKIKTRDQDAALMNVARHLGMFNDKLMLQGDEKNPLVSLLTSMQFGTLKPVDDEGA